MAEPTSTSNADGFHCSVLVSGAEATPFWVAEGERLLPLALVWLAEHGTAPRACEVSVSLVDDETIRDLNRQYRGNDAPTDVLSFSQIEGDCSSLGSWPDGVPVPLGDIVVSMPRVRSQAAEFGHSAAREYGYLLAHGLLHLLGFDHEAPDDAASMRAAEEEVLEAAGLRRDAAPE